MYIIFLPDGEIMTDFEYQKLNLFAALSLGLIEWPEFLELWTKLKNEQKTTEVL
jgi:hypothetical protein